MQTNTVKRMKPFGHKYQKKRLPCPACGFGRLIDAELNTHSELHVMEKNDPWKADYYTKCYHCKAEVGLRKIE